MLIKASIITNDGRRVSMTGQCSRTAMEQIIDAAYPDARRVSLIVRREAQACAA
jgi:hypothetical protein